MAQSLVFVLFFLAQLRHARDKSFGTLWLRVYGFLRLKAFGFVLSLRMGCTPVDSVDTTA